MRCDTICDLPDSLLTQILLNLPTKDSVRTSVLSTRWRNLWLSVPGLDIHTMFSFRSSEVFARFMDRFMEFNHRSHLQNFKIWYKKYYDDSYGYQDQLMELIHKVVDRGIQHLDVTMHFRCRDVFMSQNIYKSNTLVSLKLGNVVLEKPMFAVSLPCLKIMCLRSICYGKDGPSVVEKLISGCPVLEDLELIRPFDILNQDVMLVLRVRSQTLKKCFLRFGINVYDTDFTVEIDAPRLKYMTLSNSQSDRVVVKNLSSLFMIRMFDDRYPSPLQPEDFEKLDIICYFLTGISSVRHMIISERTLEVLYSYSKLKPIPKFNNLYHLRAVFSTSSIQLLPAFLESCPNLQNLILSFYYSEKLIRQIDFTNVPLCLISTLEYVEIKKWMMEDETEFFKLVNYFLENSACLKKLTLTFGQYGSKTKQEAKSYNKLLTSTKLSRTCEVFIKYI